MKKYLALLPLLLICSYVQAQTWQPHPGRTTAQQTAGLDGFEGSQWQKVIEFAPSDANIVYAGIDTSSVWKSIDGGANWTPKSKGLYGQDIRGIAIDPNNANNVCVATRDGISVLKGEYSTGIYRTTDGGNNWTYELFREVGYPTGFGWFDAVVWNGTSNALYCSTNATGIYKSMDNGDTWNTLRSSGTDTFSGVWGGHVCLDPTDVNTIYVCAISGTTSTGLHKITMAAGSTTVTSHQYLSASKAGTSPAWKAYKTANGNIYISRRTGDTRGIYRSTNGGSTFSAINSGITNLTTYPLDYFEVSSNGLRAAVTQSDRYGNGSYWYCNDITASTPTWLNPSSTDLKNADGWIVGSLVSLTQAVFESGRPTAFHPTNNNIMLSCTQFDIFQKSTDGGVIWTPSSDGYNGVCKAIASLGADNTTFCFDRSNANRWLKGASDYSARYTTNGGSTYKSLWNYINYVNGRKDTYAVALQPGGTAAILAVGSIGYQNLQRTANIDAVSPIFSVVQPTLNTYHAIYWNGSDTTKVYARNQISTDSGATFSTIAGGRSVDSMHPQNNNVVYDLVQSGGNILIYKSTDAASSWTQPFAAAPTVAGDVVCQFTVDPFDQNRCYVGVRPRGIYVITTSSATLVTSGLAKSMVGNYDYQSLACDPTQQGVIYAGAVSAYSGINAAGVYRSLDSGITWSSYNGNIDYPRNTLTLAVNPHNGKVFANGLHGTVVADPNYSPPPPDPVGGLPSVTTGTSTNITSTTCTLNASVNPNSGTTTIRWQLGTETGVYTLATGSETVSSSYGTQTVAVATSTTGLTASTNYFVRAQANNGSGSVNGSETTFSTLGNRLSYNASKTGTTTVTIDGLITEWPTLTIPISKQLPGGTSYSYGTAGAMWNNNEFYFAVQISDTTPVSDTGTTTPWADDAAELYFKRDGDFTDTVYDSLTRHFINAFNSSYIYVNSEGTTTGVVLARSIGASSWTLEGKLPWTNFVGGEIPGSGTVVGVDFQINNDIDSGAREGATSWNDQSDTNYFDPSGFGEIVLIGTTTGGGGDPDTEDGTVTFHPNLKMWLPIDEGTGSALLVDYTGNCPPGSVTSSTWMTGTSGAALYCDGVDDSINMGTPTALTFGGTNKQYYVSADLIAGTNTAARYGFAFSKWHNSDNARQWIIGIYGPNAYCGKSTDGTSGSWAGAIGTSTIGVTNWHNIASQNDPNMKLYVDGILEQSAAYGNLYNGTAAVRMGIAHQSALTFIGRIDNVKVFDNSLTAQERAYNIAWPIITNGTVSTIGSRTATFTGTCTPTGTTTHSYVRYGTETGKYPLISYQKNVGTNSVATGYTRTLSSLTEGTTYYYQPVAYTSYGNIVYGGEGSFTTLELDLDTTSPLGTVTINSNGTYTSNTSVTLNLTATDAIGVSGYYLSTGTTTPYGTQSGWSSIAGTTTYSAEIPYSLSSGDGTKTVYLWYKDDANNISTMKQDSIVLDTVYVSISIGTPTASCEHYDGKKVYGTTGSFINMGGNAFDTNLVTQVKINNNNTSTVNTAVGTETWSANNQRVICALDDGLVFYAKLDEPNGAVQILDSSIYGVVGSSTGSVIGTTSVFGHSRYFDGVDDYIDFGDPSDGHLDFGTSSFSFGGYMTPMRLAASDESVIDKGGIGTTFPGYNFMFKSTNSYFELVDQSFGYRVADIGVLATGTAYHLFCVIDKSSGFMKAYKNGIQVGTSSSLSGFGTINNSYSLRLGVNGNSLQKYSKCFLDDVRIYNRALSQAEITQLYQLTTPEIDNTFSTTGFDTPGNQGTDTIYVGNYAIPVTGSAISIGTASVVLNGSLTANLGNTATAFFEYGTTTRVYSGSSSTYVVNAPGTTTVKDVSINLTGLAANTEHFYRLAVTNDLGTTVSIEASFTTLELPANEWSVVTGGQWVYRSQFYKSDFLMFLKTINRYHSFRKHIRSSKDWAELLANPDSKLSSLPVD